jgi:hypothetical protein
VWKDGEVIGVTIGTNVYYGKYLEVGTVNHPPYAWLMPAVELSRDKIVKLLGEQWGASGKFEFD